MQYLTVAAALLSTSLLSSAAPTSTPLERRACSVAYPRSIGFPINYEIKQDANRANSVSPFIAFDNIPAGSYGCQLEVNFPAGYPIQSSGNSRVNVFDADNKLFGTVNFVSSPVAPTKFVVNSAVCKPSMQYRMVIASDTDAGRVAFADTKDAGLTITYNC
ncbi:hypothetical protein BCR34DRAFT_15536 [Clohesyomyces aquaticus]|uniref:Ubiquitin 3 binding protein But2 C-terminal domain-containing protein n=1 Tax=Clohesyomyces aquaticus TaxID=1231657 RepID=A0A1Y1ZCD5_9PLEO|nr:hypothetical protein BCR34DRAFT_15536 [Clohesyomyces aquaticus]